MYDTEPNNMLAHKFTSFLPAAAAITVREADDRPYYMCLCSG